MTATRVLITGATGFIAGHCIQELLTHGYAVRGSVRNLSTADVAHLHAMAQRSGGSLELVEARLDADAGWVEAVDGCAYVWARRPHRTRWRRPETRTNSSDPPWRARFDTSARLRQRHRAASGHDFVDRCNPARPRPRHWPFTRSGPT